MLGEKRYTYIHAEREEIHVHTCWERRDTSTYMLREERYTYIHAEREEIHAEREEIHVHTC